MPRKKLPVDKASATEKAGAKPAKKRILMRKRAERVPRYSNRLSYNDLMDLESQWGGTLFGPVPAGHKREFFEHKRNVWIWHEGWMDATGAPQEMTIRYEVRPAGVFKRVSGQKYDQKYEKLAGSELDNFRLAAKSYLELMKAKLYY